jgi:hypothetical protein
MSTWTPATRPTGHRTVTPSVYRNIYYLGEEIILQLSPGDAQTFEIRNYYGTVVATGLIDGTNNRIVVPPLPLGWYKVYFLRGTPTAAPWLQSGGEDSFVVVRTGGPMPPRPPFGTPRISPGGDTLVDGKSAPERGFTGFGPHRITIPYSPSHASRLASGVIDAIDEQNWFPNDPIRPMRQFVAFRDNYGLVDDPVKNDVINTTVDTMMAQGVTMFEGWNEPNVSSATIPNFSNSTTLFAAAVHAADPNALVLSPCSVTMRGDDLEWARGILTNAGSVIDVISLHNYNGSSGDLPLARRTFDGIEQMLTDVGQQNKLRMNTEAGGYFMAVYGSFEPRLQAFNVMLEYHISEQYKLPKEQMHYFYDWSHGFWGFPSFWVLNNSGEPHPGPLHVLMRVWSEELYGKLYAERLDFGSENDHWLGSRFESPTTNDSVIAVQSGGREGQVAFTVTGASSLVVTNPWGELSSVSVSQGIAVIDVAELPCYIDVPAGVEVQPVEVIYGLSVAEREGTVATASSSAAGVDPGMVIDGDIDTIFHTANGSGSADTWVRLDFVTPSRFNRVVVECPTMWQSKSTMLDFEVQALELDGVTWTTIGSATEDPKTFQWSSALPMGGCVVDSYHSRRNVWVFKLDAPKKALAVRVLAHEVTWGGGTLEGNGNGWFDVLGTGDTGGQTGPHRLSIRKIGVYLRGGGIGAPQGTLAVPQPQL